MVGQRINVFLQGYLICFEHERAAVLVKQKHRGEGVFIEDACFLVNFIDEVNRGERLISQVKNFMLSEVVLHNVVDYQQNVGLLRRRSYDLVDQLQS